MLFDMEPKTRREDLFGRDDEVNSILSFVKGRSRLLAIYGVRRVGKTSVLKVALNEAGVPYCYIDARMLEGDFTRRRLYQLISSCLTELSVRWRLEGIIRSIARIVRGVNVLGSGVELSVEIDWSRTYLTDLLNALSRHLDVFVLSIDEAQVLRMLKGFGKVDMVQVLAYVYDNLSNVKVILTGSEVGLLHDFLGLDNPKSPLYGRFIEELTIRPFNKDLSIQFLITGFRQYGVEVSMGEILETVDRLDGIVGWLTYYGNARVRGITNVNEIYRRAVELVNDELKSLLGKSMYYGVILEAIARGKRRFNEIKDYVMTRLNKYVAPGEVERALSNLMKMSIINRVTHGEYEIVDPIVRMRFSQF